MKRPLPSLSHADLPRSYLEGFAKFVGRKMSGGLAVPAARQRVHDRGKFLPGHRQDTRTVRRAHIGPGNLFARWERLKL